MAMLRKLWSLSALAVEFDMDRRTVAKRMSLVPPDGSLNGTDGADAWLLTTAVPALLGIKVPRSVAPVSDEGDIGPPFSINGDAVSEAVCVTLLLVAAYVPRVMAEKAIEAGASMAVAYSVFARAGLSMTIMVDELAEACGIEWCSASHHNFPVPPNWEGLAEAIGEKVDLQAWQRHHRAREKCSLEMLAE
jgi:hypothetical protein